MKEYLQSNREKGVRFVDGSFRLTLDGKSFIDVPPSIMQLIRKAEKVQAKITKEIQSNPLFELEMSNLATAILGINCHKAAMFARGDITEDVLLSTEQDPVSKGYRQVINLCKQTQSKGYNTIEGVRDFAAAHRQDFPFSVHIFRLVDTACGKGLFPSHSFLWFGIDKLGNEICYQKRGPDIQDPFEVVSLTQAAEGYENIPSLYVVTPVPKPE